MGFDYRRLALGARAIRAGAHRAELGGGARHWAQRGAFQLALLRHLGLAPGQRLLDVGCGPLRGGLPLIEFLGAEGYRGVDANDSLVAAAHYELAARGLEAAAHRVTVLRDFAFATLGERFDWLLCFSVLNHCTRDERARFFAQAPDAMQPHARIVVTHATWWDEDIAAGAHAHALRIDRRFATDADFPPALAPTRWSFPAGQGGPLPILVLAP
ncbi:MAG: methyltransferase domain-containing protein [Proteobacteria bacterium]|nr:methyltransferase domain-containing protein [Pseudomonadota bacterium]